jgi:hypothetical protein
MPLTVKIPVPSKSATFASRARKRGVGSFFTQQPVVFPGPNIFAGRAARGVGAFMTQQRVLFPGPNVFTASVRRSPFGIGAFLLPPSPCPADNVFSKYIISKNCAACGRPCSHRRGLGQDDGLTIPTSIPGSDISVLDTALPVAPPVVDFSNLYTSPVTAALSTPAPAPAGGAIGQQIGVTPSSDPQLDAYNQALTNAMGSGQSTAQAIAAASAAAASAGASIAKITTLNSSAAKSIPATPTATPPSGYQWAYNAATNSWQLTPTTTGQITTWLSNNVTTVALVGGAGVLAIVLFSKKGKR